MPASRTYDVVLTWLETGLRTGQLRVGQRLPSERSLAERFGISRGSVREAIRVLDAMGLVRSGVGSGPNAGAVVISEPSAALGWGLRMHLASRSLPVPDVVATRITLECDTELRFQADGETQGKLKTVELNSIPDAIEVFSPEEIIPVQQRGVWAVVRDLFRI